MVDRCKTAVAGQFRDYFSAFKSFGHNAKRFLISSFLQGLGGGILATVFGIYIKSAGLSESVVGDVEAGVALSAAVISIVGTPLVRVLGYRFLMVAAIVLVVLSRFGMAAFPVAGVMIALALSVGLGDGFMRTISSAFMSENSGGEERSHLFSVEFLTRLAAGLLGGLAGGLLPTAMRAFGMSDLVSLQWTLVIGSILLGAGIVPMLSMKCTGPRKANLRNTYLESFKGFSSWPRVWKLLLPQASIALGGGMVIPFVPLYLKHSLGASIASIGAIAGLSSAITALAVFGVPVIARKIGLPKGVALMQGLSVPFLAVVALAPSLPVAVGALWIRGALMNTAGPMYNQLSMEDLPDHEKPLVAGWMFFGLNMMWLVGNMVGGRMMEVSYASPYVAAVVLYAIGASLTYFFWRERKADVATLPPTAPLPEAA